MVRTINGNKNLLNKSSDRKVFLIWLISITCIAVGVVTTPALSVAALALFGISLIAMPSESTFALLFGLLPFANIFKLSTDSMSLFTVCELAAVACFILRKGIKGSQFIMLSVMACYLIVFSYDNLNKLTIIKTIAGFLLIGIAITLFTKEGLKTSARLLALGTIAMLLLSNNKTYFSHVKEYFKDLDYYIDSFGTLTDTTRFSGFFGDPNYCAALIVLTISLLCVLYYYKDLGTEFWVYIAFLLPMGFLTYSKSYFLCVALLLVMMILFVLFPKHKGWAVVALVSVGITMNLILNGKIETINMVLARFNAKDLTTGRTKLNTIYWQYLCSNIKVMTFGEGISADRFVGAWNNVHCLYIEMLYKLGVVGTVLYCATLLASFSLPKSKTERHFVNYLPLMFFLLIFAFLAGVSNYAFPFYIIIAFLAFNYTSLGTESVKEGLQ